MRPVRVYADTSVFGGLFDVEFHFDSREFFDEVESGRFRLVISPIIELELQEAPEQVRQSFEKLARIAETIVISDEARALCDAYIDARVVGERYLTDALHVALATVAGCRAIVSWNFKHIVHFDKIPMYNGVNKAMGYGEIAVHSPQEVIDYEASEDGQDF